MGCTRPLNFEHSGDQTGPPLHTAGTTFVNVLGVVGRNNVLACLGVIHLGLGVGEEAVKAPVEDACGDEGVEVADTEPIQVVLISLMSRQRQSSQVTSMVKE